MEGEALRLRKRVFGVLFAALLLVGRKPGFREG